jgi:hypothetical protein
MHTLRVDLQEGFDGDTVAVRLNGRELFHKSGVRTRLQIGLAQLVETEIPEGDAIVEVTLEERRLEVKIPLKVAAATYVGISVTGDGLIHQVSAEPFGYL